MADDYATKDLKCSFCGKDQNEVRKLIAGPKVFICDECVDLCIDIIADETESPEEEPSPPPISTTPGESFMPEVVAHYADTNVAADSTLDNDGVDWMCEGCGWRLRLKPSATPPMDHSEQVPLGVMGGPYRELPRLELVPRCPNPEWKRFP
jgi:hypothetical protein